MPGTGSVKGGDRTCSASFLRFSGACAGISGKVFACEHGVLPAGM